MYMLNSYVRVTMESRQSIRWCIFKSLPLLFGPEVVSYLAWFDCLSPVDPAATVHHTYFASL